MALGQHVTWSIQVRRYLNPRLTSHGPTISIQMWLNLAPGMLNVLRGAWICLCTGWQDVVSHIRPEESSWNQMSQVICVLEVGTGRYINLLVANSCDNRFNISKRGWSEAIHWRLISEGNDRELTGRCDKVSAATFCSPMILILLVNWEMKSKFQVLWGEHLYGLEQSTNVSRWWSVSRDSSRRRRGKTDTILPYWMRVSSSQKVTVRKECGSHRRPDVRT